MTTPERMIRPVVGLGVSTQATGNLAAFMAHLDNLGEASMVVVPHSDEAAPPPEASLLLEIVASNTSLPVFLATDGCILTPGTIFVAPPDHAVYLEQGTLRCLPCPPDGSPDDTVKFFPSLAREYGTDGIAVVLGENGYPPASGLKEIRSAGGIVMLQGTKPENGETRDALAAWGEADCVLPAPELSSALSEWLQRVPRIRDTVCRNEDDEAGMARIEDVLDVLQQRMGHDFTRYKRTTITRRLEKRMLLKGVESLRQYQEMLETDKAECEDLVSDLLIGVTSFFRDSGAFRFLARSVLPELFRDKGPQDLVRVWIPGCSTGEEAYSLAILIKEHMEEHDIECKVEIFATDIDRHAVDKARRGLFSARSTSDIPAERLERHFRNEDGVYTPKPGIRKMVVFAPHDLLRDPPFIRLDLISCRNLLIYFNQETQQTLLPLFHNALNPGGYLFLGSSEAVDQFTDMFQPMDPKWKVLQRTAMPASFEASTPLHGRKPVRSWQEAIRETAPSRHALAWMLEDELLLRYAPPAVLINEKGNILYYSGDSSRYLHQPSGAPTDNLVKRARPGLRARLRPAVQKAIKEGSAVTLHKLQMSEDSETTCTIRIQPVANAPQARNLFTVTFEEENAAEAKTGSPLPNETEMVHLLERELAIASSELQETIEELETTNERLSTTNEELMSMNEELQSSNEELETSREELQSLNEELVSVNTQLSGKVGELQQAHTDIENLLSSSHVATVLVDRDLVIRRFTPQAVNVFHIIESDLNRPLDHVVCKLEDTDLIASCRQVLEGETPREHEVESSEGRLFLKRLYPYTDGEQHIAGVVLTFLDITELSQTRVKLQENITELSMLYEAVDNSLSGFDIVDEQGRIVYANNAYLRMWGFDNRNEVMGTSPADHCADPAMPGRIVSTVNKEGSGDFTFEARRKDGSVFTAYMNVSMYKSLDGRRFYHGFSQDVTERHKAAESLRMERERLLLAMEATGAGVYEFQVPLDNSVYLSDQWSAILGFTREDIPPLHLFGSWLLKRIHPAEREAMAELYERFLQGSAPSMDTECRVKAKNGRYIWLRNVAQAVERDDAGRVTRVVGLTMDVSAKKRVEKELERRVKVRTRQLQEQQDLIQTVLSSFPNGTISLLDRDLRFVLHEGNGLRRLGVAPEDFQGKTHDELFDAELVESVRKDYARAFLGETVELRATFMNRHFRVIASPLQGQPSEHVELIVVVAQDITEQVEAEEQTASLARFPDENPHPVMRVALNGKLIYANKGSSPLLRHWKVKRGGKVPASIRKVLDKALQTARIMKIEVGATGRTFDISVAPIPDKGYANLYCLDITDRRAAQKALEKSEELFRSVVENVEEGFWIRDFPKGEVVYASPNVDKVFGFPQGTILDNAKHILEAVDPESRDEVCEAVSRLWNEGVPMDHDYWLMGDDGKRRFLHVQGIPLLDAKGTCHRVVAMAIDLTQHKLMEEELREAKDDALAANSSKSEFLANMSHEIRTPLNGVMGMLQLLKASDIQAEQQEYVNLAMQSSKRLTRLLTDILDLSRVEANILSIQSHPLHLETLLREVHDLFQLNAAQTGIEISYYLAPAIPGVLFGDAQRLLQVLSNLVGNALKFTLQGHVHIEAYPLPARTDDSYRVLFSVSDTGAGINAETLEALFEPFVQGSVGYRRDHQGAGLGLAICKRIISLMDGHIDIASEPNKGTSIHFCVTFQLPQSEPAEIALPAKAPKRRRRALHVLVAEDDKPNQVLTLRLLDKLGHTAHAVEDGSQVLDALSRSQFDLVLLDIQMPVMDGMEATRAIRAGQAGEDNARVPIIALTAYAMLGDREAFLDAGMDDYLAKPVELDSLDAMLQHHARATKD